MLRAQDTIVLLLHGEGPMDTNALIKATGVARRNIMCALRNLRDEGVVRGEERRDRTGRRKVWSLADPEATVPDFRLPDFGDNSPCAWGYE